MRKLLLLLGLATRLTGAQSDPIHITSMTTLGQSHLIKIRWEGSLPPYKVQMLDQVGGEWRDASYHIYKHHYIVNNALPQAFFRVRSIPDTTPPPSLRGFGPREITCDSVRFTWDAPSSTNAFTADGGGTGLSGVRIYRDGVFRIKVRFPTSAFTDQTVVPGTTYTYWASAVDEAGNESPRSGSRVVVIARCTRAVTLAWDDNPEPDVVGYVLHYGTESGVYTERVVVGNKLTHTLEGLLSGTTYHFAASAYNMSALEGELSEEVVYAAP